MSSGKPYAIIISLVVLFSMASFFIFNDSPILDDEEDQTISPLFNGHINEDYDIEKGTIKKYYGTDEIVVIPSVINGETVTRIGSLSFLRGEFKSITIPNTVTRIDNHAFKNCALLESIAIPDSVLRIESYAFNACTSLESIDFGNGLKHMGASAFLGCTSLTTLTIPDSVTSLGINVFNGCTSLESVTIGTGLKDTGNDTFNGCISLKSVTLKNGLEAIGNNVFDQCLSLESIVIPDSVSVIGDNTFRNCSSLKFVTLGNGLKEIGNRTFHVCTALDSLIIPDSVTTIGIYAFKGCSFETITVPNSVTSLGKYAFEECTSLESVILGNGITSIDMNTFDNCTSLESITIPDGVTSIGINAFRGCTSLKSVVLSDSVTTLENSAFNFCKALESVTFGSGMTSLGSYAFGTCVSLKNITIPDSVTFMDNNVFSSCSSLESIIIPDGITEISSSLFLNCSSLKSVVIPDSVTTIKTSAFKGCSSLESVIIPAGVTTIGASAFNLCTELKTVILLGEDVAGIASQFNLPTDPVEDRMVYIRQSAAGDNYAGDWDNDIFKIFHSSGIEGTPDFIVEFEDSENVRLYWYPSPYKIVFGDEDYTDELLRFSIHYREIGSDEWIPYYNEIVPFTGYSGAPSILLKDIPARELCEFKVIFYDDSVDRTFESKSLENMSKIIWKIDGYEDIITWVPEGETPAYSDIPVKESSPYTDYTFTGWDPAISIATENATYTAMFDESAREYTITFVLGNGEEDIVIIQGYNTELTIPENPVKEGHTFVGWDSAIPSTIPAEDLCIRAVWDTNFYTITWTIDKTELDIDMEYDSLIKIPRFNDKEGHTFAGWDIDIPEYMPANDLSAVALWSINTYSITWVVDGTQQIDLYVYGTEVLRIEDPAKEGYTFIGWSIDVPETMPAGNLTLVALWSINEYTITLVLENGEDDIIITCDYETLITRPNDPVREGHTFNGWDTSIPGMMPATDMVITALWSINEYTITLVLENNEDDILITCDYGTIIITSENPTREGHTFIGWDTPIPETMPAEDITASALWSLNTYTVSWDIDGTIFEVDTDYGSELIIPRVVQKEGHEFLGWDVDIPEFMIAGNLEITAMWSVNEYSVTWNIDDISIIEEYEFGTEIVEIENPVKEGYTFDGWDKTIPNTMSTENLVFFAVWSINTYEISWIIDDAIIKNEYEFGANVTSLEDPSKEGHTFDGWDTAIPSTMPAKDLNITAEWSVNSYFVTWIIDDVQTVSEYEYGNEIVPVEVPCKEGYTSTGWSIAVPPIMPAEDLAITATWSINTYEIAWVIDNVRIEHEYAYGNEIIAVEEPDKEGYTFNGWDVDVPDIMPARGLAITATWTVNTYTISWVDEDIPFVTEHKYGSAVTSVFTPSKEGHTFNGWDVDVPDTMPAENLEIKAQWTVDVYSVFWIVDDNIIKGNYEFGSGILEIDEPVKTGYTFNGWDVDVPDTMPAKNLTLTANWSVNTYFLTWTFDNVQIVKEQRYGSEIVSSYFPVKEGHSFIGWDLDIPDVMPAYDLVITAEWSVNSYSIFWISGDAVIEEEYEYGSLISMINDPVKNGYTFTKWNKNIPATMPAEDFIVIAEYSVNEYSVIWVVDNLVIEHSYDYGDEIVREGAPVKDGYTFAGWSQIIPETMPSQNLTFVAEWDVDKYTLTLDFGEYGIDMIIDYGSEIIIDGVPERQGYNFVGWNQKIPARMPAEDITVSAVWELKTYVVTWIVDGNITKLTEVEYGAVPAWLYEEPVKEQDSCQSYQFDGWFPKLVPVTCNAEYHASFIGIPNTYTVTYDMNGGTGDIPTTKSLSHGTLLRLSTLNGIHKEGHTLEGWSTSAVGNAIDELEVKSDVTIYAIWSSNFDQESDEFGTSLIVSIIITLATVILIAAVLINKFGGIRKQSDE